MNRFKNLYLNQIVPQLQKELNYTNPLQVPRVQKVILNMGVGQAVKEKKALDEAMNDLRLIAGQQPAKTLAKHSIAGFSLRKDMPIGCRTTLRGERMYEFLDKLFNIVLPRTRDFHGLSLRGFDGHGNYSLGIAEQTVFPEIDPNKVNKIRGLQVTIVTDARDNKIAELLLRKMGCPLEKKEQD